MAKPSGRWGYAEGAGRGGRSIATGDTVVQTRRARRARGSFLTAGRGAGLASWLRLAAFAPLLLAGCAARSSPSPPPPPPASPAVVDTSPSLESTRPRPAVRPVEPTAAFLRAIENGTRTADGTPGPRYWQNRVEYRIAAELDPESATMTGMQTARLHNASPDTLRTMVVHLHQNVFSQGVPRTRRVPITGGMNVDAVQVDGVPMRRNPADGRPGYRIDGTLMTIDLPYPIMPGRMTELQLDWRFRVPPRGAPRTGHDENEVFVVAQWYPQIATYDDLRGWHDRPYWSNGEFYLEYGDFDVELTLPEGWVVGATGTLTNAGEVLPPHVRERLAVARTTDDIVPVVTIDDIDASMATERAMGGQLTWRFTATNVRDFAFATSNNYVWDVTRAATPDATGDGVEQRVMVHALYRPEAQNWRRAADYMQHALRFHARRWLPYPWPHITAAEGPIGGMEYPMLVFIGAPAEAIDLYAVLSHEIAHQWWPMIVGSNETDHAWQDEGLATWAEDLSVRERFPESDPHAATRDAYLAIAGQDDEAPIERRADLYGPGRQYGIATYQKPAALLRALGEVIGSDTLVAALAAYTDRWAYRHPASFDFFNTVEAVVGRDLDWFWSAWWHDTATLDHAVVAVEIVDLEAGGEQVTITVEDRGGAPMPVPLTLTLDNGDTVQLRMPVEPWLEGRVRQRVTTEVAARVVRVEIDAAGALPDTERRDNVWTRPEIP
jgi:hypothetical protein